MVLGALAVRYELQVGAMTGATRWLVSAAELMFLVGVIPLTVTSLYSTGALLRAATRGRDRRTLPVARRVRVRDR